MALDKLTRPQLNLFINRLNENKKISYYLETLLYFLQHDLDTSDLIQWWSNNDKSVDSENALNEFIKLLERIHIDQDDFDDAVQKKLQRVQEELKCEKHKRIIPSALNELEEDIFKTSQESTSFSEKYPQFRHIPWIENILGAFQNNYGSISAIENLALVFSAYLPDIEDKQNDILNSADRAWVKSNSMTHDHLISLAGWVANHYASVYNFNILPIFLLLLDKRDPSVTVSDNLHGSLFINQRLVDLVMDKIVYEEINLEDSVAVSYILLLNTEHQPNQVLNMRVILTNKLLRRVCRLLEKDQFPYDESFLSDHFFRNYSKALSRNKIKKVWPGAGEMFHRLLETISENGKWGIPQSFKFALNKLNPPVGCVLDYLNQYYLQSINLRLWQLQDMEKFEQSNNPFKRKFSYYEDITKFCELWFSLANYMEKSFEVRDACILRIFGLLLLYCHSQKFDLVNSQVDSTLDSENNIFNPWYIKSKDQLIRLAQGDLNICQYKFGS